MKKLVLLALVFSLPVVAAAQTKYETEPLAPALREKLDKTVGSSVYSCARRGVLLLERKDSSGNPGLYYGSPIKPRFLPVMAPLKIVAVDKVGDMGPRYLMAMRLDAGGGFQIIVPGLVVDPQAVTESADPLRLISSAASLFVSPRDSGISFSDLRSVMAGQVHKGMSEEEAKCTLGVPERSNEYGEEAQNVYDDGLLIVYIANSRVVNVQHFDRISSADN